MKKINLITKLLVLLAIGAINYSCNKMPEQPNILFIMADDHGYQAISSYGDKLIQTPNIDRIADEGVLFNNAFVCNSICGPSRACILTGKFSHKNGFMNNGNHFDGSQQTFPKLLQKKGYVTAIVGKWHLRSEPTGFDFWNILPGQGHYYNPNFIKMGKDTVYNGYVTDITTDLALEWLNQNLPKNSGKPFCLMLHQKAPHRNWMPPQEYLTEFNDRKFEPPANFFDDYEGRKALQITNITVHDQFNIQYDAKVPCDECPTHPVNHWCEKEWENEFSRLDQEQRKNWDEAFQQEYDAFDYNSMSNEELSKWKFQRYMEDYLRCIKSVDDNVGRILDYLDNNGLTKNTIVVYTSDQGFYLGEHGLYDKRYMYEETMRTPMLMRFPKEITAGKRVDNMVMNIDFASTFLDFAGADIPSDIQGESMKPILTGEGDIAWRDDVYYHYYELSFGLTKHYGLRTDRYKIIHFYDPVDAWELYDLENDPAEMNNLIDEPDYKTVLLNMKQRLASKQIEVEDIDRTTY
jgi:arylsulfatase A-like enzyme